MSNQSKNKGTRWETTIVRWLSARLGDAARVERLPLHGSADEGDIRVTAGMSVGIIEAKNYREWGPRDLERWQAQTIIERCNANADWAILAPKRYGYGPGRMRYMPVYLTFADMCKLSGVSVLDNAYFGHSAGDWVWTDLETLCSWLEFDPDATD